MRQFIFLFLVICAVSVAAKPIINDYVVDEAGILSQDTEQELRNLFQEVEKNTSAQMAVVTVKNLEGEAIEEYSLSLAHNRLGDKEKDNGLLLLVALEEREYRIEVGYGLEGILNDAKVGRIAREHLVPYFKDGNYDQGVLKTSYVLADVILGNDNVEVEDSNKEVVLWIMVIGLIIIFVIIIISASKNQGQPGSGRRIGWIGGLGGLGGRSGGGGFSGGGGNFGGGGSSGRFISI